MSDPIPSATADPDNVEQNLPSNAEDRKAAAALSSLHTNEIATEGASGRAPDTANQEALGKAMSRLEITAGQDSNKKGTAVHKSSGETAKKKVVKIASADVALLVRTMIMVVFRWELINFIQQVDQLDLTKAKATDLLKAHDGDATKAMKAFIAPRVWV